MVGAAPTRPSASASSRLHSVGTAGKSCCAAQTGAAAAHFAGCQLQSHSNHCVKSCAETHAWKGWEEDRILLDVSFPVLTNGDSLVRVFVAMNVCQTLSITRRFALRGG